MNKSISHLAHTLNNAEYLPVRTNSIQLIQISIGHTRQSVRLTQKSIGLTPNPASGILCALAHCKLYFAYLKIFSGTQNHLPRKRGRTRSEVVRPVRKFLMETTLKSL
jgi:hypothetical protein